MSNVCDQYCVFYLIHRAQEQSMNTTVKMFDGIKNIDDRKVFSPSQKPTG